MSRYNRHRFLSRNTGVVVPYGIHTFLVRCTKVYCASLRVFQGFLAEHRREFDTEALLDLLVKFWSILLVQSLTSLPRTISGFAPLVILTQVPSGGALLKIWTRTIANDPSAADCRQSRGSWRSSGESHF